MGSTVTAVSGVAGVQLAVQSLRHLSRLLVVIVVDFLQLCDEAAFLHEISQLAVPCVPAVLLEYQAAMGILTHQTADPVPKRGPMTLVCVFVLGYPNTGSR